MKQTRRYRERLEGAGECIQLKERILSEAAGDPLISTDELAELIRVAYPDREAGA